MLGSRTMGKSVEHQQQMMKGRERKGLNEDWLETGNVWKVNRGLPSAGRRRPP